MRKNIVNVAFDIRKSLIGLIFIISFLYINVVFAEVNTEIYINGSHLVTDVAPVIIDGYTYVPIRNIGEILGYTVNFDETSQSITMYHPDSQVNIAMALNSDKAYVNNEEMIIPAPPVIIENRTMVPVRFVSEALSSRVDWNEGYEDESASYPNKVVISSSYPIKLSSGNACISSGVYSRSWTLPGNYGDECSIMYDIVIPQFSGMKDNAFQQTLNQKFKINYEQIKSDIEKTYEEQKEAEVNERYSYSDDAKYIIMNDAKNVLSIVEIGYFYAGGAHGMPYKTGVNIDFNHSKVLMISDLFKNDKDYSQKLLKEINDIRLSSQDEYSEVEQVTWLPAEELFYFQDGKLVVFYPPYDLACFARGFVEFRIPLGNLTEYLKDEYKTL